MNYTSTRPKTMKKVASDLRDIRYIICWLAERREHIRFEDYAGKPKPDLLAMVRKYHDKYVDDSAHVTQLRGIMPGDWDDMLALPAPEPEEPSCPP